MKNQNNGKLSGWQLLALFALFFSGGVGTMGGGGMPRDIWLLLPAAGILAVPLYLLYLRLARIGGGEPVACFERAFGRVLGRAVLLCFGALALVTAASGIRIFTDFTAATALPQSPRLLMSLLMAGTLYFMLRGGGEVLGRLAAIAFFVIFGMLTLSFLVSIPQFDWGAVLPIGESGWQTMAKSIVTSFIIPFLEGFFAVMVLTPLAHTGRARKSVLLAVVFSGVFLGGIMMKNVMLLGYPAAKYYYYPSYTAGSLTVLGRFFQRTEILISAPFLLSELVKSAVCLMFARKAVERVFPVRRGTAAVLCLLALGLSLTGTGGVIELIDPLKKYAGFVIIPLLGVPLLMALLTAGKKAPEE